MGGSSNGWTAGACPSLATGIGCIASWRSPQSGVARISGVPRSPGCGAAEIPHGSKSLTLNPYSGDTGLSPVMFEELFCIFLHTKTFEYMKTKIVKLSV